MIAASMITSLTCYAAYIDPATTSYIIQIAAGVVIALGTVIGIFWNKITRVFRKKKDTTIEAAPVNTASDADEKKDISAEDLLDD